MTWLRWDAEYDNHPDIVEAGWEAAVVFERVCRIAKKFNLRGRVKEKYMTAHYLHQTTKIPMDILEIGLANCFKGSDPLIKKDSDGCYVVCGWTNYQLDPTNAERQAAFKERKKEEEKENEVTEVTVSNGSNDDGTLRYGTNTTIRTKQKSRKPTPKKIQYLDFVTLSLAEVGKLTAKHGIELTNQCIDKLNNHKGATGKMYKSDYHAILKWVVDAVKNNGQKQTTKSKSGNPFIDILKGKSLDTR